MPDRDPREPSGDLTARQRQLLSQARDAIAREPSSYDQQTFGMGAASCGSPACVAGHMVTLDPECAAELAKRVKTLDRSQGETESIEEWQATVYTIADEALGTRPLVLFATEWPASWFRAVGRQIEGDQPIIPFAADAVAILDGILDGRIRGALDSNRS